MPLYEYKCSKCDQVFEIIQKFSDEPLTMHENCGGKVERLLSTSALQFKGSGFYITDYGRSGSKSGAPSPGKNGHGSETKSEKPAATTAAKDSSK